MAQFVGQAMAGDRFIGLPCGCVVLVRNFELVAAMFNPGYVAQSESMFKCKNHYKEFTTERITDFVSANVYFECQAIQEPKAEGLRWQ